MARSAAASGEVLDETRAMNTVGEPPTVTDMDVLYHHRILAGDGMRVHIDVICRVLTAAGHTVSVVGPRGGGQGVTHRVGGLRRHLPGWLGELLEIGYNAPAFLRLARRIRAQRPDAIYERYNLYLLAGVWASRIWRLPLVVEVNAPLALERQQQGQLALPAFARWAERTVWRSADRVLPVSGVLAGHVTEAGVPADRVRIVPNGAEPSCHCENLAVPGAEVRRRYGLDGKTVFGFVGFVRAWHGLDAVLDVLAGFEPDEVHLLIVGDGPARPALEEQAARLGITRAVTFVGTRAHAEIPGFLGAFDVALQPAVTPYASPLKLIEYMAAGRAIIAPDQPNIRELVHHDHAAWLVAPGDRRAFADAVGRLAADAELRTRLGDAARAEVAARPLSWEHNGQVIAETLQDAAKARHGRRGRLHRDGDVTG